ncbi:hypothetical protein [Caniella muris]|uniref:hypothetical protein n=1 Tax=Caniella muris TaxID=2941502 RepID=UPI00203EBDC4|nr:hypothetical protein [Caniella muris]
MELHRPRHQLALTAVLAALIAGCLWVAAAPRVDGAATEGAATEGAAGEAGGGAGSGGVPQTGGVPDAGSSGTAEPSVAAALEAADDVPWESEEVPSGLADAAGDELEGLRDRGFSLVHGGYLDLLGNVWGCVAQGADEVVVCVVSETAGGTSVVSRLTLGVDRWEGLCG